MELLLFNIVTIDEAVLSCAVVCHAENYDNNLAPLPRGVVCISRIVLASLFFTVAARVSGAL